MILLQKTLFHRCLAELHQRLAEVHRRIAALIQQRVDALRNETQRRQQSALHAESESSGVRGGHDALFLAEMAECEVTRIENGRVTSKREKMDQDVADLRDALKELGSALDLA
ncbi:hypothetical protein THASP1DRAFT_28620 [Thamnocephalis sphaerospora]|uniref:Uncharacterized protein n=1 Tax=Thamnocephalis sphaerospora TaxID=78915 RepID=A0A4P9XTS5_9FUNG|nr:hypothetical protein THASP1DRAFT_28620 [Thamnocephalis sphaerospora]|eukprot:RKP09588.1 hypothetical protein THASP1DRAFT_28620 [Thamnocephalis sphaerospora]